MQNIQCQHPIGHRHGCGSWTARGPQKRQIMSVRIRFLSALLAFIGCTTVFASSATNESAGIQHAKPMVLATGNERGIYFAFGHAISNAAAQEGLTITVRPTQGSVENMDLLLSGQVDLCLAQSDVLFDRYKGKGPSAPPATNLVAIAPIYTEAVHILVRKRMVLKRVQDFSGKRLCLGPKGSGTEVIARRLLDEAGISLHQIQPIYLDTTGSVAALNQDEADIVFLTSGFPSPVIDAALQGGAIRLFEPNADICEKMLGNSPYYVIATIPRLTYSGQYDAVTTIGIRAFLASRSDLQASVAYALTKAVKICRQKPFALGPLPKEDTAWDLTAVLPLSAGAAKYYKDAGYARHKLISKWSGYALGVFLSIGIIFILARFRDIRRWARSDGAAIIVTACFLFLVWATGSLVLYYAEHKINDNYGTIYLSLWATLINWLNFGAKEPYTLLGRATCTAMMALGFGGALVFVRNIWKGIRRMKVKYKDHYVVVNWNQKGPTLLQQLQSKDLDRRRLIVIVSGADEHAAAPKCDEDNVIYIEAPVGDASLQQACVNDAVSVMILADDVRTAERADTKTVMTILSIRQLQKEGGKPVPIIAEIRDPGKVDLASFAGDLKNGQVEVVSSDRLGVKLLCQAAVTPGVTQIYEELLTFGEHSDEFYSTKVPDKFVGSKFSDVIRLAAAARAEGICVIPVGIRRGDQLLLNSSDAEIGALSKDDFLFAISDNLSVMKKFLDRARGMNLS